MTARIPRLLRSSGELFIPFLSIAALSVAALILPSSTVQAQVIQAADRGWYDTAGNHTPTNTNMFVGQTANLNGDHRNFLVFNIPSGSYTSAILRLQMLAPQLTVGLAGQFVSKDETETYELHDVTTSIASLVAGGGASVYTDLGNGLLYGSRVFSSADNGTTVDIVLNANALARINAVSGGQFAMGGSLSTYFSTGPQNEYIFGGSDGSTTAGSSLVLAPVVVPESSSFALALPALGMVGAVVIRRCKK